VTVLDDDDSDLLTGGSGKDWYFAGRVDRVTDNPTLNSQAGRGTNLSRQSRLRTLYDAIARMEESRCRTRVRFPQSEGLAPLQLSAGCSSRGQISQFAKFTNCPCFRNMRKYPANASDLD
jgi:hypothetical protein